MEFRLSGFVQFFIQLIGFAFELSHFSRSILFQLIVLLMFLSKMFLKEITFLSQCSEFLVRLPLNFIGDLISLSEFRRMLFHPSVELESNLIQFAFALLQLLTQLLQG